MRDPRQAACARETAALQASDHQYGELVDRYRGDPARLALLRPLGDEIRRLEAEGTLPGALVARSERRPRR